MGLDGVELIMAIEERFGIEIPDDTASEMLTAGDLHLYILGRMHEKRSKIAADYAAGKTKNTCLSSRLFYLIRRTLQWTVGIERFQVQRHSSLDELIPRHGRLLHWENLRKGAGLRLPNLKRPIWLVWSLFACICLIPAIFALCFGLTDPPAYAFLVIPVMIAVALIARAATTPFALCFPDGCLTIEDLVQRASKHISVEWMLKQTEDIWPVLKEIIIEQLGVTPEEVTKKARFVDDLGVG